MREYCTSIFGKRDVLWSEIWVLWFVIWHTLSSRINVHARLFFRGDFSSLHALITPARFYLFPEFPQPAHFLKITYLFFQPAHFEKNTKVIFTQWFDIEVMTKLTFFNVEVIYLYKKVWHKKYLAPSTQFDKNEDYFTQHIFRCQNISTLHVNFLMQVY